MQDLGLARMPVVTPLATSEGGKREATSVKQAKCAVKKFPETESDDSVCVICLSKPRQPTKLVSCSHVFCKECISKCILHEEGTVRVVSITSVQTTFKVAGSGAARNSQSGHASNRPHERRARSKQLRKIRKVPRCPVCRAVIKGGLKDLRAVSPSAPVTSESKSREQATASALIERLDLRTKAASSARSAFTPVPASVATSDKARKSRDWTAEIRAAWSIGEAGALAALTRFAEGEARSAFEDSEQRFRADREFTACISPHMRFGELSPRRVWHAVRVAVEQEEQRAKEDAKAYNQRSRNGKKTRPARVAGASTFLRRLLWRDLAYWALWFFPHMPSAPLRPQFRLQQWTRPLGIRRQPGEAAAARAARKGEANVDCPLRAWQLGLTGFPLVDAAMRQMWAWGWMPNYCRHVVAGFLVEYLGVDWR